MFGSGNMYHDRLNMVIRGDIFKTQKLIITFLWQSNASTCQFSLNSFFIFPFQLGEGESVYCCKRESLTPFLSPWRWYKAFSFKELPQAISIISCSAYSVQDCKLLKAEETPWTFDSLFQKEWKRQQLNSSLIKYNPTLVWSFWRNVPFFTLYTLHFYM